MARPMTHEMCIACTTSDVQQAEHVQAGRGIDSPRIFPDSPPLTHSYNKGRLGKGAVLSQCFVTPRFSAQSRVCLSALHPQTHARSLSGDLLGCTSTRLRPLAGTGGGASEAARSAQVCGVWTRSVDGSKMHAESGSGVPRSPVSHLYVHVTLRVKPVVNIKAVSESISSHMLLVMRARASEGRSPQTSAGRGVPPQPAMLAAGIPSKRVSSTSARPAAAIPTVGSGVARAGSEGQRSPQPCGCVRGGGERQDTL